MKKFIIFIVALITLTWTVPVIAKDKRDRGPKRDNRRYEQRDRHHRGDGYRYRYYGHRKQHKHRGHYRGHWKSWRRWEEHRRDHRRDYRESRYYRRDGQLYFEFENEDGRFVFSIGR